MNSKIDRQKLDRELLARGVSLRQLAATGLVSRQTIWRIQRGAEPRYDTMARLRLALAQFPVIEGPDLEASA